MTTTMYCRTLVSEVERQGKNTNDQVGQCSEYTVPTEHEPASKKQRKQHHTESVQPTMKRAPKRTPRKKVQFRHVKVEEPRLDYEQWSAIVQTGFGGILSVRTKLIPKKLARWLLEKYDSWDNSLNLANDKLLIDEEDVYTTLGLPMRELEIIEGQSSDADIEFLELWRRRWNVERGGTPIGSMDEVILERGGHGHKFITDFITYAISICIVGNANGTCHFRVVKVPMGEREIIEGQSSDADIEFSELWRRRWNVERGGTPIGSMDEVILERGGHGYEFITDFITYAMSTCIVGNANGTCHFQLFYLDRVQFRGRKVDKSFPIVINWDTEKVRNRDKDEQLAGEHGKGRIIERIDYQTIACLAEAGTCTCKNWKKANLNKEELVRCPGQQ
ncbi:hypothetical protein Cgig2_000196 [Carnegiea gigantea]|uniref:Uncharacterized protein n=1 Tax=Carnegiea gigantea TaxID=171969 RepID=A0A9Q1KN65_9CARY|nr:hypothetical protein Cgig2_000196 [Carnegiea gigantea]